MNVSRLSVIDVSAASSPMDPPAGVRANQYALSALHTLAAPSVSVIRLYTQALQATAAHDTDAESLHQLRVATRRLRALLWAYAPLLRAEDHADADAQLKALADIAGHTRDWDILLSQLSSHKQDGKSRLRTSRKRIRRLRHATSAHRDAALTASHRALQTFDVDRALSLLTAPSAPSASSTASSAASSPLLIDDHRTASEDDDGITVAALAAQALPRAAAQIASRAHRVAKAAKALKAAESKDASTRSGKPARARRHAKNAARDRPAGKATRHPLNRLLVSLHRTRVAIKKLRYLSDLFAPVLTLTPKALAKQNGMLAKLQTRLGKINDDRASADMVAHEWIDIGPTVKRVRSAKANQSDGADASSATPATTSRASRAERLPRPGRATAKALRTQLQRAAGRRVHRAIDALDHAERHKILSRKHWRKVVDTTDAAGRDNRADALFADDANTHAGATSSSAKPDTNVDIFRL